MAAGNRMDVHAPSTGMSDAPPWDQGGVVARRGLSVALLVVAIAYVLGQVVLVDLSRGLEWDEAVYLSQVSDAAPAAPFEAHRARGITALVAPVAAVTDDLLPLRLWLALVSGVGLYAAFAPWRGVTPVGTAPVAALLFGLGWLPLFYGSEVSPNLYVALGSVAAIGYLTRLRWTNAVVGPVVGVVLGVAVVAFMRPPDSVWLAVALAAGVAVPGGSRRLWSVGATAVGLVVGWLPWVVEAFARFSGPVARFSEAAAAARTGWSPTFGLHLRLLDGGFMCCFGEDRLPVVPWQGVVWWAVLAALVLAGVMLSRSVAESPGVLVAALGGLLLAVPYLFLTVFVLSRFLLPTYALLAVPAALAVVVAAEAARQRQATVLVAPPALTLFAFFAIWQLAVLVDPVGTRIASRDAPRQLARVAVENGISPPCHVLGARAPAIAFELQCTTGGINRYDQLHSRRRAAKRLAAGRSVAVFWRGPLPETSFANKWKPVPLDVDEPGWRVYLPPKRSSAGGKDRGDAG